MKRLLLFLVILGLLYSAKPYWEKPVSQYIDLDFLEPVDASIEKVMTSEPFVKTVHFVNDTVKKVTHFFVDDEKEGKPEKVADRELSQDEKPILTEPVSTHISIHNIEIGMPKTTVEASLGRPADASLNEYGTMWHTYHKQYNQFMMVAYDEQDDVQALYTNDDLIATTEKVGFNSSKHQVRAQFGEPLTEIKRGLKIYVLNEDNDFDVFKVDDVYMYVFYDVHREEKVTAMQIVSATTEEQKQDVYAASSEALQEGFERQLFHLTNASRVRHQLAPLDWHEHASKTAYRHSVDMAEQNYFSHQNLQGLSPFDRMREDDISFRTAGENLAYGQASSIFAHEGLMNSAGHRENILQDMYTHLGIGVSFNEEQQPYFTALFLSPS